MEGIIDLHHTLLFYLAVILVFVTFLIVRTIMNFNSNTNPIPSKVTHGGVLEII